MLFYDEFVPNKAVVNIVDGRGHSDFDAAGNAITAAILDFLDKALDR